MNIRTIHIGVGGRGLWPFKIRSGNSPFKPVALVDTSDAALQGAMEMAGLPDSACFTDAEKAIREVGADAVVICTPTVLHGRFCRLAFAHRKHVLVEKAMTNSLEDARALIREAKAADVKFCVVQNLRYYTSYRSAKDILADPSHPENPGKVAMIDFMHHRVRPNPGTHTYPFAMVWDMGVHHMDLLVSLIGPVESVESRVFTVPWSQYNHPENIHAFLRFRDGAVGNYFLSQNSRCQELKFMLQGEKGAIRYVGFSSTSPEHLMFFPVGGQKMAQSRECPLKDEKDPSELVAWEFANYIATGDEPGISGHNNLETLIACQMLCDSTRYGRSVSHSEYDEICHSSPAAHYRRGY